MPRGMLQVATGDGTVGAALAGDHVTFAGSARVAGTVAAACAQRLVPFALELALAPVHVVFADADLDAAVAAIARALGSRVLVERPAHDELVARLEAALEALTVGPAHEDPDVGPQIDGELVRPAVVAGGEPPGATSSPWRRSTRRRRGGAARRRPARPGARRCGRATLRAGTVSRRRSTRGTCPSTRTRRTRRPAESRIPTCGRRP